jgi:hypothetical protein
MSDLEKSLAQEECKAIKTKMTTALVDKIGDGAPRLAISTASRACGHPPAFRLYQGIAKRR